MVTIGYQVRTQELLQAYAQKPSVALRNQIVTLNLGLVRKLAHRLSRQCTEPYEDLEQIGSLGLIRAVERFDPGQGCAFSSFAVPYIRGEMLHFLRDRAALLKLPRAWQRVYHRGQTLTQTLQGQLGRAPREAEVASQLGLSLGEWRQIRAAAANRGLLSLDVSLGTEGNLTLAQTLADGQQLQKQQAEEEHQQVREALGRLEVKTRQIIESVFWGGIPRKQVAETIGVSPMTITRWIQQGLAQLLAELSETDLSLGAS